MNGRDHFINKASKKFNNKFDYTNFEYVNAKTRSEIVYPEHGKFYQAPDKHLQSKYGCLSCWDDQRSEALTGIKRSRAEGKLPAQEFAERIHKKFGDKFWIDLSGYTGYTGGKVRFICPVHGEFWKIPVVFLTSGHGCTDCGMRSKDAQKLLGYDDFLIKARAKHGNKYDYPECSRILYADRKILIKIICKTHGVFTKKAQKHLAGQGCFRCRMNELIEDGTLVGGYNKRVFDQNPGLGDQPGWVYYMKIGDYYKVGITRIIGRRLAALKSISKEDVKLLDNLEITLFEAWRLEQKVLSDYHAYRVYLSWSKELFTRDVLKGKCLNSYR